MRLIDGLIDNDIIVNIPVLFDFSDAFIYAFFLLQEKQRECNRIMIKYDTLWLFTQQECNVVIVLTARNRCAQAVQ